jgi:tRNA(adenine34) deaminase
MSDSLFMQAALQLAQQAAVQDEVPVGAVVVYNNEIIGCGANRCISDHDPTAHAEIVAMRAAAQHRGNYRLTDCDLYVTLEPCMMCAGAMVHARIRRLVIGAPDPKTGVAGSVVNYFQAPFLNHWVAIEAGVMAEQSSRLLKHFFQTRR